MATPLPQRSYTVQPVPANYLSLLESSTTDGGKEKVLWIGCSDSSVSETDSLTNVDRSEIFVHRNLGNRVSVGDLSSESALEWCVEGAEVQHIIVCGHYDCHLLSESESDSNNFYRDFIRDHQLFDAQEPPTQDKKARNRHFEELFVLREVEWIKKQKQVQQAIEKDVCQVHAFIYDRELGGCVRLVEKEGQGEE